MGRILPTLSRGETPHLQLCPPCCADVFLLSSLWYQSAAMQTVTPALAIPPLSLNYSCRKISSLSHRGAGTDAIGKDVPLTINGCLVFKNGDVGAGRAHEIKCITAVLWISVYVGKDGGRAGNSFNHKMGTVEDRAGAHFLCIFWLLDVCVSKREKKASAHFFYLNIKKWFQPKMSSKCLSYIPWNYLDHFRRAKKTAPHIFSHLSQHHRLILTDPLGPN